MTGLQRAFPHLFRRNVPVQRVRFEDPFRMLDALLEAPARKPGNANGFVPRIDVVDDGKSFVVTAELPGVDESSVEITLDDGVLVLKGEKKRAEELEGEGRYRIERSYGAFTRTLSLPADVDADQAEARFDKGVLSIVLPRIEEEEKVKRIAVTTA